MGTDACGRGDAGQLSPGDRAAPAAASVAGKTKDSELRQLLIEKDPNDRMPRKADALPAAALVLGNFPHL